MGEPIPYTVEMACVPAAHKHSCRESKHLKIWATPWRSDNNFENKKITRKLQVFMQIYKKLKYFSVNHLLYAMGYNSMANIE